jgi:hypothetical protein
MDAFELMHPTPAAPPAPPWHERATGRIIAERIFEVQPDAPEGGEPEEV